MKLPIQKTEHRKEPMKSEMEFWPASHSLMEKILPEGWFRSWSGLDKNFYPNLDIWVPTVDVVETKKEFNIIADVPGVKPEDIKVEIAGDDLVISGKSEEEKEEKGKTWHRIERRSGSFYREFEIPKGVDLNQVEAAIKNGRLTVKLIKKPEAQSKVVEVKVNE
ncbi:MAG: Hsp20/alpha crystallin family protein [Candidatus Paceibacterota bacterium]